MGVQNFIATTIVAVLTYAAPLGMTVTALLLYVNFYTRTFMIAYMIYIFIENKFFKASKRGWRRSNWFRNSPVWKLYTQYFPLKIEKTTDLDASKPYVWAAFPHGIISIGAFGNLTNETTGFSNLFPNLTVHLLAMNILLWTPFAREVLLLGGGCDVEKSTCLSLLKKKHSICIMVGGAKEALDAHKGVMRLTLKNRMGFVKVALESGAALVPVVGFGENELFEQAPNPKHSKLRQFQDTLQALMGFSLPVPNLKGQWFGLLPKRQPVTLIVGRPIEVPHCTTPAEIEQHTAEYHQRFMNELKALFDTHKKRFYAEGQVPEMEFA